MGTKRNVKVMKLGDDPELEKAVYIWFRQKRMEKVPISGPLLCEKAVELYKTLHKDAKESDFVASEGWKYRFCKRHGIRQLSLQGEKLSADIDAADEFVASFPKFVKEGGYSLHQVFNCDETGLNFRLLPTKTLAQSFEKLADGHKKSKDRVTVNLCSNAAGTIKLPLHVIGKANRPRCFKGVNMKLLPVCYRGQKNAWMDCNLFREWFHDCFVPSVRTSLLALGQEAKAVLVLDNCSAHPDPSELVSKDGKILAKFLPANVTSLVQPMDQGVIETVKRNYKKKLLRGVIIADDQGESIIDFVKSVNMSKVVQYISESWDEVSATTLRRSWNKILPVANKSSSKKQASGTAKHTLASVLAWKGMDEGAYESFSQMECNSEDDNEEESALSVTATNKSPACFYSQGIRVRFSTADFQIGPAPQALVEFQGMFQELGYALTTQEVVEWLDNDANDPGVRLYTDTCSEICDLVMNRNHDDSDDEVEEESKKNDDACQVSVKLHTILNSA